MGDFVSISASVKAPEEENYEIITAFLSDYPFSVFELKDHRFFGYLNEKDFNFTLDEINEILQPFIDGEVEKSIIKKQNWNALWEKNYFEPITVENRFYIRADFHIPQNQLREIVIQPKMSFGTGHHATTQLMLGLVLKFENLFYNAAVLDMGSGTGILAIAAEYLGAKKIDAIEIEAWSAANIGENALRNDCKKVNAIHADAAHLKQNPNTFYDLILANIHREVLIEDVPHYTAVLNSNGLLFMSGFYPADLATISQHSSKYNLTLVESRTQGEWCAAVFKKP
jgi:ribosomal protein L11 methyltransferase